MTRFNTAIMFHLADIYGYHINLIMDPRLVRMGFFYELVILNPIRTKYLLPDDPFCTTKLVSVHREPDFNNLADQIIKLVNAGVDPNPLFKFPLETEYPGHPIYPEES